jgi:hypothetical protein
VAFGVRFPSTPKEILYLVVYILPTGEAHVKCRTYLGQFAAIVVRHDGVGHTEAHQVACYGLEPLLIDLIGVYDPRVTHERRGIRRLSTCVSIKQSQTPPLPVYTGSIPYCARQNAFQDPHCGHARQTFVPTQSHCISKSIRR